jgi:hypothetical protein
METLRVHYSPMDELTRDIEEYEKLREDLEAEHTGKWVLIKDRKLVALHDSFEKAAEDAVKQFGQGPYLIRQIGAPPITLSASAMYHIGND